MSSLLFFKLVKGETTIKIKHIFEHYKTNYLLRENSKEITCKHHFNNEACHNSFFYRSVEIWNKLPNELVSGKKFKNFD